MISMSGDAIVASGVWSASYQAPQCEIFRRNLFKGRVHLSLKNEGPSVVAVVKTEFSSEKAEYLLKPGNSMLIGIPGDWDRLIVTLVFEGRPDTGLNRFGRGVRLGEALGGEDTTPDEHASGSWELLLCPKANSVETRNG